MELSNNLWCEQIIKTRPTFTEPTIQTPAKPVGRCFMLLDLALLPPPNLVPDILNLMFFTASIFVNSLPPAWICGNNNFLRDPFCGNGGSADTT